MINKIEIKTVGIPIAWVRDNICKLVNGDKIYNSAKNNTITIDSDSHAQGINYGFIDEEYFSVTKFAARKNTGVQPVADGVVVDTHWDDEDPEASTEFANIENWSKGSDQNEHITTWKPNFDASLKMYEASLVIDPIDNFWQQAPKGYDHYIIIENGSGFGDYYKLQGDEYVNKNGDIIPVYMDNITVNYRWACDDYLAKSHKQKTIESMAKSCCMLDSDSQLLSRLYDAIEAGEVHNLNVIESLS